MGLSFLESFMSSLQYTVSSFVGKSQGVWNIREKETTRPAIPYDYICFRDGTPFEKEFLKVVFYFLCVFYFTI